MQELVAIKAPHFYAGVVVRDGMIVEAAPIVRYMIGKSYDWLTLYVETKGWQIVAQTPSVAVAARLARNH
jgi:hypothetical protein